MDGEEENVGPFRRTSARTRRMASRMASALASSDNRAEAALARLEALESDNAGVEVVDLNDDEYGSTDEEDPVLMQKKQSKIMKRKTRQGKALEKQAARSFMFMDVLQETNLESLPPHVPTYLRAAVGPPSTSSRRHYCSVCGTSANYTCVRYCMTRRMEGYTRTGDRSSGAALDRGRGFGRPVLGSGAAAAPHARDSESRRPEAVARACELALRLGRRRGGSSPSIWLGPRPSPVGLGPRPSPVSSRLRRLRRGEPLGNHR